MPTSLTRLFSQIGVVLGRLEYKLFGGPLGLKGLMCVAAVLIGLIAGGCLGIVSLMSSTPREVKHAGGRTARSKTTTTGTLEQHLLECDAAEPPSEDDRIYVERACTTLGRDLAGLTEEEFHKAIAEDYVNRWIVEPGWVGRITRIARMDGPAGSRSIVTILEGGGRIVHQAKIYAATTESVSHLRVGDRVYVQGWICDMKPPGQVNTTRGKAKVTPGVVLLAGATIKRD